MFKHKVTLMDDRTKENRVPLNFITAERTYNFILKRAFNRF